MLLLLAWRSFDGEVAIFRFHADADGEFARSVGVGYSVIVKYFCNSRIKGFETDTFMLGVILDVGQLCRLIKVRVNSKGVFLIFRDVENENLRLLGLIDLFY